ncbi:unnamed protein product, partial [marine sediment metagenome]
MEIVLQGHSTYQMPDWKGAVEVNPLKLFQVKRIAGSKNNLSLFRKFLKIFKSPQSPLVLPEDLIADDLDVGDFTQILVGISAVSKGRQVRKTYTCPNKKCEAPNPRVLDVIKTFIPIKPELEGGKKELTIKIKDKDIKVDCKNISI